MKREKCSHRRRQGAEIVRVMHGFTEVEFDALPITVTSWGLRHVKDIAHVDTRGIQRVVVSKTEHAVHVQHAVEGIYSRAATKLKLHA